MALGTDARGLRRSRVLTQAVGRVGEERFLGDLDLVLSAGGFPTVAVVRQIRRRSELVLARMTPAGRVRERQLSPGVRGRVDLAISGTGRVAVLLEDSGGDDGSSECGGGSGVRRVWASTRAAGERRFGPLRLLDQRQYVCFASPARLVVGPADQVAVAWGTGDERVPPTPPNVRVAVAGPGDDFIRQDQPGSGAELQTLAFSAAGALQLLTTQPPPDRIIGGPLILRTRAPDGTYGAAQPLAPFTGVVGAVTGADGDVLTLLVGPDGRLRLVALR